MDLNTRGIVNYLLLPIAGVFYLLSSLRRRLYRIGLIATHHFDVPVIVVGNITVGGSGKTPIVIALVNYFKQQGKQVGVVSRGYGGAHQQGSLLVSQDIQASKSGDEPLLIATQTQVPVIINKDRSQAVKDLITNHHVDLIISDDGLQHYAMGRSVEIAVVDGQRRFGNGFFLPAGPLRESESRLKSVDFVINNGALYAGEIPSGLVPKAFINVVTNEQKPLDFFANQTCHAIAGIGHPQRFFDSLVELGVNAQNHAFADHHLFTQKDLEFEGNYPIIMTAKDCVKCKDFATQQMWYLQVDADLSDDFLTKLTNKL
ncbi:MAG TPA: tetraacyldisaccharide 4'-kinase [Piscirickettsiaceae bacterium]|nr:tetraacyldisaccharide 4'-kinase [Piscirickettsiaceae bacterium]